MLKRSRKIIVTKEENKISFEYEPLDEIEGDPTSSDYVFKRYEPEIRLEEEIIKFALDYLGYLGDGKGKVSIVPKITYIEVDNPRYVVSSILPDNEVFVMMHPHMENLYLKGERTFIYKYPEETETLK